MLSSSQKNLGKRPILYASTTTSVSDDSSSRVVDDDDHHTNKKENTSTILLSDDDDDYDDESNLNLHSSSSSSSSSSSYVYPWSKNQEWALRDNLPKYIIRIPMKQKIILSSNNTNNNIINSNPQQQQQQQENKVVLQSYVLWRSLLQDVPELAGYPVDFLQARYRERQQEKQDAINNINVVVDDIGVLPYLQDYEFSTQGGVCGTVYGLEGVADGSRIETSAVTNVQETLRNGYIQTSDGSAAFELGRPISIGGGEVGEGWKMLASTGSSKAAAAAANGLKEKAGSLARPQNAVDDADGLLLRLGATTGILLAGAAAINMISHHMTVNVFWV
jgi:hypothetical protein